MRLRQLRTLTCLSGLVLCTQAVHVQAEGNKAMEPSHIQTTIDANTAAVAKQDIEAILNTYAPDAVMVGPTGTVAEGTAALRGAFEQFLVIKPKITITKSTVVPSGDVALHLYGWTMSGKTPDGQAVEQTGLSAIVLRKQANGQWLMVIDNPFADQVLRKN